MPGSKPFILVARVELIARDRVRDLRGHDRLMRQWIAVGAEAVDDDAVL